MQTSILDTTKRLTTETVRALFNSYIKKAKLGGNVMLASKSARHTNLQTTMIYIHAEKSELYESIERAQNNEILERVKNIQNFKNLKVYEEAFMRSKDIFEFMEDK